MTDATDNVVSATEVGYRESRRVGDGSRRAGLGNLDAPLAVVNCVDRPRSNSRSDLLGDSGANQKVLAVGIQAIKAKPSGWLRFCFKVVWSSGIVRLMMIGHG